MELTQENILLVLSAMLFISLLVGKAGFKFGVPSLLLFLIVGMFMGTDGVGYKYDNFEQAQFIGTIALSIILFSGGMDTRFSDIRPVVKEGIVLATVGVMLTALLTGTFIYFVSKLFYEGLTVAESMLLASVMSSTDSASVFSILRSKGLNLSENLRPVLELESGSNDPMAFVLTIVLIEYIKVGAIDSIIVASFFIQLIVGVVAGLVLGKLSVLAIRKISFDSQSVYVTFLVACVLFVYSFTWKFGGNGYLAVYIAGLIVGNAPHIPSKRHLRSFFSSFTWLWQILMFLTLGLLVNPKELLDVAWFGLSIGIFMIFLGRPISVFISLLPFKYFTQKARLYISWVGLRGAVPIIFATYPVIAEIPHARMMFNVVFFITIISLIVQGTSVPYFAHLLGLGKKTPDSSVEFGLELPEEIDSATSELAVDTDMISRGNTISSLALPEHTLIILIKRADKFFIPRGKTVIEVGDKLLLMSDDSAELEKIHRSLGEKDFKIEKED